MIITSDDVTSGRNDADPHRRLCKLPGVDILGSYEREQEIDVVKSNNHKETTSII